MKPKLILGLALVLGGGLFGCAANPKQTKLSAPTLAQAGTNKYGRISIADVGSVRLEVEQLSNLTNGDPWNGIQVQVNDFAAEARQKKEVVCDLYAIDEDGKEANEKFMSIPLQQVSRNSRDYSGKAFDRHEFEHGNKFKVVYKIDGLPLPISTWYACYYH